VTKRIPLVYVSAIYTKIVRMRIQSIPGRIFRLRARRYISEKSAWGRG